MMNSRLPLAATGLAASLAIALIAGPAPAQTNPDTPPVAKTPSEAPAPNPDREGRRAEMRERMQAADTNKDGQFSREEWLAAGRRERGFDMMDADQNGQLTQQEMREGMERMQAMRGQGRRGPGTGLRRLRPLQTP